MGPSPPEADPVISLVQEALQAEADRLQSFRVLLFGSRARGEAQPRSDYDLGILGAVPMPLVDFYALAERLEQLPTLLRLDWVDLQRADPEFRQRALQDSLVIWDGTQLATGKAGSGDRPVGTGP